MVTSEHAQLKAAAHSNNTDNAALERIREFSIGKLEMGRWLTPSTVWPPPKPLPQKRITLLAPGKVPPIPSLGPTPAELVMTEQRLLIYLAERSGDKINKQPQQEQQQEHKRQQQEQQQRNDPSNKNVARGSLPADERRHGEEICASRARARISPDQQKEVQKMHEALNETLHELWESPEKLSTATALAESIALDVALTPVSEEVAHTILRKVRALRHLSADELLAVLHASSRRLLPRYTHAMREGAACECCFVVLAGSLEIYRSQAERDELNRQMKASIQPDGRIVEVLTSGVGSVAGVALVSEVLGEEGLVLPSASRERSLITLEPVELLVISPAAIAHLRRPAFCSRYRIQGVATVTKLLRGVESLYIERALRRVPFFTTLPRLTQEHISSLFVVRCVAQGERCVEQGEPASAVFVLLAGCIERWRRLARPTRASGGAKAHLVGEIVEGSSSPWFSQVRMAHVWGLERLPESRTDCMMSATDCFPLRSYCGTRRPSTRRMRLRRSRASCSSSPLGTLTASCSSRPASRPCATPSPRQAAVPAVPVRSACELGLAPKQPTAPSAPAALIQRAAATARAHRQRRSWCVVE